MKNKIILSNLLTLIQKDLLMLARKLIVVIRILGNLFLNKEGNLSFII
jgi:hypothetical protein